MSKISPTLGVCYYPEHWPQEDWAGDATKMKACGIEYVRIAEFAWSRFEITRGCFDFDWLDLAIETLGRAGLKVIMCTPTATPPKWLVDEMPDMIAIDENGAPRKWGSRRHYDFSHQGYRQECRRITEVLAKRYGENPHVVAWQTDNEYGCHDTTLSYSAAARAGFRDWLAQKFQSPEALNRAWGNVFWSMEVNRFDEVELPNLTATEPNPSHVLDFRRYASDQVVSFNRLQVDLLKKLSPGRDIVHNFMGKYLEFDHFDVGADLDVATWDSYPLGNLERFGRDDAWKNWYLRAGDPDFQAFHHDLYRACGKGRMWVMEQQPGPVNWADWNPDPHPGMVRLWSHEAIAHGAEVVSYFRWRQAPFAQEQFHAALNRPDGSTDRAYDEARQVADDLHLLKQQGQEETVQSPVALLFDYPSQWATEIQPQGADYDGFQEVMRWYAALRRLGQNIDIVSSQDGLEGYKLIVVPHFLMPSEEWTDKLFKSSAKVIFGPRCGSRTPNHQIPENLGPGQLQQLIPVRVLRTQSLRPGVEIPVHPHGCIGKWAEQIEPGKGVVTKLQADGFGPVLLSKGDVSYIAGIADDALLEFILKDVVEQSGLLVEETGDDIRLRDRGALRVIVNYGPKPVDASHLIKDDYDILVGSKTLEVAGVLIAKKR